MKLFISTVVGLVFLFVPLMAQTPMHGMNVEVQADRILIGGEFVPRPLNLPAVKVVALGEDKAIDPATYDYIEVQGTATMLSGTVNVTHLFIFPGATLRVACGVTLVGRNVPINTGSDPFQWGNGLLNFGTFVSDCPEETPFLPTTAPLAANATQLTLSADPVGWTAGDELVLPDTRQSGQTGSALTPRRETGTLIKNITGRIVTLSKPLAFARDSVKIPDGSVVLQPRVGNLTRRTVIKSEDPNGVRWHIAMVGAGAGWDVRGTSFVGLGRTRNEKLNNTTQGSGSQIGTNQVGRYVFHDHHTWTSFAMRRFSGNAIDSKNLGKWGVVVHQSHDAIFENNICVDTPGACFSTEDGNEVRNVFRGNFAAYVKGNGTEARENVINGNDCRGCESAMWFAGVGNIIEKNEAWNSQNGIDLFNIFPLAAGVQVPTAKGASTTMVPVLPDMVPISMKDNVVCGNTDGGSVYWQLLEFPNERLIACNNATFQAKNGAPNGPSFIYLTDAKLVCTGGVATALGSSSGYNAGVVDERGQYRGCGTGVAGGMGKVKGHFTGTVFQNVLNINLQQPQSWAADIRFTDVMHVPLPGNAPFYFYFDREGPWPGPPAPLPETSGWAYMHGSRIHIKNWQGTGKDYDLLPPASERSGRAWVTTDFENLWQIPPDECGATIGEIWDKCGLAYGGEAYAASEGVALTGVQFEVGVPAPRPPLNAPECVLTAPNMRGPAVLGYGGYIPLYLAMTGQLEGADRTCYLSIDGGPTIAANGGSASPNWVRHWTTVVGTGTHTVRSWRQLNGVVVGPSFTVSYRVGPGGGTPPPDPPTPVNCALSAVSSSASVWTLSGTMYTRTITETKTIVTAPANGGTPCQP